MNESTDAFAPPEGTKLLRETLGQDPTKKIPNKNELLYARLGLHLLKMAPLVPVTSLRCFS